MRRTLFAALAAMCLTASLPLVAEAGKGSASRNSLGTIRGFVRDAAGNPITGALVSVFKGNSLEVFRQVRSSADGSFLTKVIPGNYTLIAAANGFNSARLTSVEVGRASELSYNFDLQPAGSGRTVPEKKANRGSSMWVIRAAQIRRSIYQHREGDEVDSESLEDSVAVDGTGEGPESKGARQTVVEQFQGYSLGRSFLGINFAGFHPINSRLNLVIAGQAGFSGPSPRRLEGTLSYRHSRNRSLRVSAAIAQIPVAAGADKVDLSQLSLQATDEWRLENGVVILTGVDFSKFLSSGSGALISPRLGLQFDVNSRTRLRAGFTSQTDNRGIQSEAEFEDVQVIFREPASAQEVYFSEGRANINRSSRLEFGVERIIDSRSTIEATGFLDLGVSRGVGLVGVPFDSLDGQEDFFVVNQQGRSQGVRAVYSRRINDRFSTSAGFAVGSGQRLADDLPSNPSNVFEQDMFQTVFGQFGADLRSGTNVRTVFRFSPQATVFAIDPFQGRLAIFDPSLSVTVTQNLPNMGLPFRAEAVLDARNILDYQSGSGGDEKGFRLSAQRRMLRGGIKVRF